MIKFTDVLKEIGKAGSRVANITDNLNATMQRY